MRSRPTSALAVPLLALAAVALTGCAGGDDAPDAAAHQRAVVAAVFADLGDDDLATLDRLVGRCLGTLRAAADR